MAKQLTDLDVYSFISGYATINSKVVTNIVMNEIQEVVYSTPGSYMWRAPIGVTNISVVCVGGGGGGRWGAGPSPGSIGGGGGGALAWVSNFTVIPNNFYLVVVGQAGTSDSSVLSRIGSGATVGGDSYFIDINTCFAGGGKIGNNALGGGTGGTYTVTNPTGTSGGGAGGNGGGATLNYSGGGGGGAGGYTAAGGAGGTGSSSSSGGDSTGGGGGGGAGANQTGGGGGGGGVGIYGAGANGSGGTVSGLVTIGGTGGSSGSSGTNGATTTLVAGSAAGNGGSFGGGSGGVVWNNATPAETKGTASSGVVRIIWGTGRSFPNTNTEFLPLQSTTYTYPSSIPQGYSVYTTRQIQGDNLLSTNTTISINTTTNPPTGMLSSNANFTGYFEILIAKTKTAILTRLDQNFVKIASSGITNKTIGWN